MIQQVPDQHETIIASTREHAASGGIPLDGVEISLVALEFEEGGSGLADVEDADDVALLGKGGEEVGVVWGGCETEEGRGRREGLGC